MATPRRPDFVAAAPWVWTVLITVVAALFGMSAVSKTGASVLDSASVLAVVVLTTAMGAVLHNRVPENKIWLLFMATGPGLLMPSLIEPIVNAGPPDDPTFGTYAALVYQNSLSTILLFVPFLLLLYIFPTGRFLTRRWRWAGWTLLVAIPTTVLIPMFSSEIGPAFVDDPWLIPNPIGFITYDVADSLTTIMFTAIVVVAVGGVFAIVTRFRRSSKEVRAQIKWLLLSGLLFFAGFVEIIFTDKGFVLIPALLLVPVSVAVAITRYRLYEVDRLISRTVTYLLVIGSLIVVFVAGVVWIPARIVGEQSSLFVAGSTLAVASLFNPLRKRVQKTVDKRFNRSAYEADRIAERFADKMRGSLTVEELGDVWAKTVQTSLQPQSVGLWLRDRADQTHS
jgi:hypothetical protein